MTRALLAGVVLCSMTLDALAGARLGGLVELEGAVETGDGRAQKAELIVLPELEWRSDRGFDLTVIGRIRADAYDRLEPGRPGQSAVSPWTRRELIGDQAEIELRELYLDAYLGSSYLRIGKQQIVWGEADGLKVLDLVNPQSFREFILDEFEDSRIPLWSVKWELPVGDTWNAQVLFIPDPTFHVVPEPGAVFEITAPELIGRPPPPGVPVLEPRVPDDPLSDADGGLQLSAYLDGWDVTLNYLYHYADSPVVEVVDMDVDGVSVRQAYRRTHTAGGTLSNAFGDFTLRTEAGYSTDRYFPARDGAEPVEAGELSYVAGFDWMGLTDTLVSVQVFQSHADLDGAAVRDDTETDVTVLAQRTFWNQTLDVSVLAIHDADNGDGVVTAEVGYDYQANLRLHVSFSAFYGDADGRFGQFDRRDRVLVGIEYGL